MEPLLGRLLTLALCWVLSKGLESEQCVEVGPGKVSTLSFRTELHKLPPDFWSKGVDNSKMILETILGKIKLYEKGQDKKWAELIQNIGNQYSDISGGQVWLDDKKSQTVRVESIQGQEFCGLKEPISGQIEYNCAESEQLYGISYHKVYEACKHNPILANYKVDWGVCLHAHYPWIDLLSSHICVMKSYNNDFIACFCAMEEDSNKLKNRGFCITKFECLLNKAGVEKSQKAPYVVPSTSPPSAISPQLILQIIHAAGQVSHDCAAHVQYFIEVNTKDTIWFGLAQQKDNLRVRPPYHPESPCRNVHFIGQFDIGQLDVDNIEAGIEVYTPYIDHIQDEPPEPEEPEECAPPLVNNVDPVQREQMDLLTFFFGERIVADLIIWLPGILFLYSSICEERNRAMQLLVTLIQSLVITIGIYNIVISALPLDMLKDLGELRHIEMVAFSTFFCLAIIFLNSKEVTEFFLKLALICFIPDIVFWKMVSVMYTKERMENFKVVYMSFLLIVGLATAYNVLKIVMEVHQKKTSIESQPSSAGHAVKVTKKKKVKQIVKKENSHQPSNPETKNQGKSAAVAAKCSPHTSLVPCPKKVSKESGSLTSSLLEKWPAKAKTKSKKSQRSSSETSSSCGDGLDSPLTGKTRDRKKPPSKAFVSEVNKSKHAVHQKETKTACTGIEKQSGLANIKPHSNLDPTSHQSHLVDHLVQQYCPQNPGFVVSQKSKILTIIQENNQQEEKDARGGQTRELDAAEDRTGFLLGSGTALPPLSDSLFFVPGQQVPSTSKTEVGVKPISEEILNSPTLEYRCGSKSSAGKDLFNWVEGDLKERGGDPLAGQPVTSTPQQSIASPLTRILIKEIDDYPAADVDKATKEILLYTNIEDLTIPEFQKIVVEKLRQEQEKSKDIYISDESEVDDEDECHICLASLDEELEVLEGCGHIFHVSCISSWVARKESEKISASCPKCRAAI